MNTWIVGKDLMNHHCLIKRLFIVNFIEKITDKDYISAQKIFEEFNIKTLGEYHDLYVQSDELFLADEFENCRNKCINI